MDSPVPEGVTVHDVGEFSLRGIMVGIPYQSGDYVRYGGVLFKPVLVTENPHGNGGRIHYLHYRAGKGGDKIYQGEVWDRDGSCLFFHS